MKTVEEIERAIEQLSQREFARLASWVNARADEQWTRQRAADAATGRLDFLFAKAETERVGATTR